jgi:hypothetical protein
VVRALARRVGRIEARRPEPGGGPPLLVLFPDDWPDADVAAFDGGDPAARADAVERHAGVRPGPATCLIVLRTRPDGPQ